MTDATRKPTLTDWIVAVRFENISVLEDLMTRGMNIDVQNGNGDTALHLAISYGCPAALAFLLEKGANVEIKNRSGHTPLIEAIKVNREDMVCALLARNADIENPTAYLKRTPLMVAGMHGNGSLARLLLEKGARLDVKDVHGDTAEDLAAEPARSFLHDERESREEEAAYRAAVAVRQDKLKHRAPKFKL